MKAFARWIKASTGTQNEPELYFRKNTILQFGNSWDVIGAAILINPGSALPTDEVIDCDTISKLQEISNNAESHGRWRVFKVDPTMRFLEKIFSGWYLGQTQELEGVILLYNLFNIRCTNLDKALQLRKDDCFSRDEMFTRPDDLTPLDVPFYIGWGSTGKSDDLKEVANRLFECVRDRVSYYTGVDAHKAPCYHPIYVNRSYRKPKTQNLLRRFLQPYLINN